jgi:hypothetical protein
LFSFPTALAGLAGPTFNAAAIAGRFPFFPYPYRTTNYYREAIVYSYSSYRQGLFMKFLLKI